MQHTSNPDCRRAGASTFLPGILLVFVCSLLLLACKLTEQSQSDVIIYLAKSMGPATQIHGAREDGSSWAITRDNRWRDLAPDLSARGQVVFMSNRHDERVRLGKTRERFQVFLTDVKGEEPRPLTRGKHSATRPRFSPDATQVAYIKPMQGGAELWSLELESGEQKRWARAMEILDFSWSPEGRTLASVQVQAGRSSVKWLTPDTETHDTAEPIVAPEGGVITNVSWSPTGDHLAYVVHRQRGARELWLHDFSSGEERRLSAPENHVQAPVSWSRDGRTLLYGSLVDFQFFYDEERREKVYEGAMHIFSTDREGTETQLTEGEGRHGAPVYSPDEQRIAFLYADSLDADQLSLRTMNRDGSQIKTLDDNVAPASQLQWLTYTGEIQP